MPDDVNEGRKQVQGQLGAHQYIEFSPIWATGFGAGNIPRPSVGSGSGWYFCIFNVLR